MLSACLKSVCQQQILYGELTHGKRSLGGQRKRFKDTLKTSLKSFSINPETWEATAADRPSWRGCVSTGATAYETGRNTDAVNKRAARKMKDSVQSPGDQPTFHAHTVTDCSGPVSDSQVTYGPTKTNDIMVLFASEGRTSSSSISLVVCVDMLYYVQ
jgi:hypothetical protein